jgi:hypothetical protein
MICHLVYLLYTSQDLINAVCLDCVAVADGENEVEVRNQVLYLRT